MRITMLFFVLFTALCFSVHSQQTKFSGKITDAQFVPVAATIVYLLNTNQGNIGTCL
jgi:hypothetical protein